jgi:hypothetical protein
VCGRDIADNAGCWNTMLELDHALVRANFDEEYCLSCARENGERVRLHVSGQSSAQWRRKVVLGCGVCGSVMIKDWRLMKPPSRPKGPE